MITAAAIPIMVIALSSFGLTGPSSSSSSSSSKSSPSSASSPSASPSRICSCSSGEITRVFSTSSAEPIVTKSSFGLTSAFFRSKRRSSIVAYLRSGLFMVHFKMIFSKLIGSSGAYALGATISSCKCCKATATVVSPSNGTRPVTISYITIPRE